VCFPAVGDAVRGLSGWFSGEWPRLSAFAVDGPRAPGWQAVAGPPLDSLLLLNTPALRISPRGLSFRSLRSTDFLVLPRASCWVFWFCSSAVGGGCEGSSEGFGRVYVEAQEIKVARPPRGRVRSRRTAGRSAARRRRPAGGPRGPRKPRGLRRRRRRRRTPRARALPTGRRRWWWWWWRRPCGKHRRCRRRRDGR